MSKKPNVVLITSDQWATRLVDGSGTYESGANTPGIDRLAAEGMRFGNSYASFPLCCSARAGFFTGLMPHKHRIIDNEESYRDKYGGCPTRTDVLTMGKTFQEAGYQTAYFGKEHAGDYGWKGIDEFGSMTYSSNGMLRFNHYKYIHSEIYGQEYELLFDLAADPDETTNLFGQPGYEAVSGTVRRRLADWLRRKT